MKAAEHDMTAELLKSSRLAWHNGPAQGLPPLPTNASAITDLHSLQAIAYSRIHICLHITVVVAISVIKRIIMISVIIIMIMATAIVCIILCVI